MINAVLDWEKSQWKLYDGTSVGWARRDELLTGAFWSRFSGVVVGVEKAHLRAQNGLSKAQIYEERELAEIHAAAESAGVSVVLIPESQSFRARELIGAGDDKTRMPEAYFELFKKHPEITLQRFPVNENASRKAGIQRIKAESNHILNVLRPDYQHPLVEIARDMLSWGFEKLSPEARRHFQVERARKGLRFNETVVMSIFAMVRNASGDLRTANDRFIGVDTVMRALTQNPYKGKESGTARSNIMMHWHRKRALRDLPREQWAPVRAECRRVMKELIRLFRDAPRRHIPEQTELF